MTAHDRISYLISPVGADSEWFSFGSKLHTTASMSRFACSSRKTLCYVHSPDIPVAKRGGKCSLIPFSDHFSLFLSSKS